MMIRTHLAVSILAIVLILPYISNYLVFVSVVLLATFVPDIDSPFSTMGRKKKYRFLQFFSRHRGIFHTITMAVFLSAIIAFFSSFAGMAFFLGYSLHVFADSLNRSGVRPFWPFKIKLSGNVRTGSYKETLLFVLLTIFSLIIFIFNFKELF